MTMISLRSAIIIGTATLITIFLSLPLIGPVRTRTVESPLCSLDCGFSSVDFATQTQYGLPFPVISYQEYVVDPLQGTTEKKREKINWIAAIVNVAVFTAALTVLSKAGRRNKVVPKQK